mgnify:FL=1
MKVVVVGAGQIADAHIIEVGKIKSASVVGLCDLFESPLLALKEKYAIPHVDTDFVRLMELARPDVVHITTPPTSHLFLAKQALAGGAHVYIEKPLTVTHAEAVELFAAAKAADKQVCIGTNRLFARAQSAAITKIKAGELGQLTHVDAIFTYDLQGIFGKQVLSNPEHWISKLPGQIFQNNLNHPLATVVPFLSDDFQVRAWADDWSDNGVVFDELRVEIFDRANKFTAHIVFSSNVKPGAFRVSYFGRRKTLFLDNNQNTLVESEPSKIPGTLGNIFAVRAMAKVLAKQFRRSLRRFVFGQDTFFTDMNELFRAFYDSIDGKGPAPVPESDILRASLIIDEVNKQIGRPDDDR